MKEFNTAKFIAAYLKKLGLAVQTQVGETGVVGILVGNKKLKDNLTKEHASLLGDNAKDLRERVILLRADMDALPVTETVKCSFVSQNKGVMHACGHDCHMSMLMCAAKVLSEQKDNIYGTIKFIFQPGEESHGGAFKMIKDGVLEKPHVDEVYGCHVWSESPFGVVSTATGPVMAGSNNFEIKITGKGGHGGIPHSANDAVIIACQLVIQLQTIVSRNINPGHAAALTVGKIEGGTRHNIIAETVTMIGTCRFIHLRFVIK
eukprot:UN23966